MRISSVEIGFVGSIAVFIISLANVSSLMTWIEHGVHEEGGHGTAAT